MRRAIDRFGSTHLLINNAGVGGGDRIEKTSTADFDRVLKTNLYGKFWCSRAVYPHLRSASALTAAQLIDHRPKGRLNYAKQLNNLSPELLTGQASLLLDIHCRTEPNALPIQAPIELDPVHDQVRRISQGLADCSIH